VNQAERTEALYHRRTLADTCMSMLQILTKANHDLEQALAHTTDSNPEALISQLVEVECARLRLTDELRAAQVHIAALARANAKEKREAKQ
jgi:hypothetical protein